MLGTVYRTKFNSLRSVTSNKLLVYIWLLGLLLGSGLSFLCRDYLISILPKIFPYFLSVPLKSWLTLLPFFLSVAAAYFSRPICLFYLCGIKAIWFAACCFLLCLCYGRSGWLARWLFLFFDVCSLPLLFFYWLRLLKNFREWTIYEHLILLLPLVALISIDYRIMTPYAAKFGFY